MRYAFGDYELDTQLYELRHAGQGCPLEPQVFDVLVYLVQHRDRVVSKDELLDRLWPAQFISDAVLHTRIMAARKAVGDSGQTQRVIKTLRGRGYRFVAPVQERVRDAPEAAMTGAPSRPGTSVQSAEHHGVSRPPSIPTWSAQETWREDESAGRCPQCNRVNQATARVCHACGARVHAVCPVCTHSNPLESRFCNACGAHLAQSVPAALASRFAFPAAYTPPHLAEKILTCRSTLAGERKQVTVLLCEIADASGLAERLGAEAMHSLLHTFFALALSAVHRYEGTITQCLGDGFMALFGAPLAHEDHARRAVLAAMGLQRHLATDATSPGQPYGVQVSVCIGLHTGHVIVGAIGDTLRMDYTAVGDTINAAASLQQAAAPGQVVISEVTYHLVSGYCTAHPLGEVALQGNAGPARAWEVQAVHDTRTRLDVEAERGLTRFVGRQRELRLLHASLAQAQAGQGHAVFIVGEPAIGKSRLLREFRRQLGMEVVWLEGHALSFGRSMALHPVVDLLKRMCHMVQDDAPAIIVEKLTHGVQGLGDNLSSTLPYLRYLLAVDAGDAAVQCMDPRLRRAEIFAALRRLMLQTTDARPHILLFEDLHWMDEATATFLALLIDSLPASRVLCLMTHRPGYVHPFGDRTYHTRLVLSPLASSEALQMARALLATAQLPTSLETLIVQKAEGNPFFVEELVKSLRENEALQWDGQQVVLTKPLEAIEVPSTLQALLMARIDRLPDLAKDTLQLASVIGREFTRRVLDQVAHAPDHTEGALQVLKAAELIYEVHHVPEPAYVFKHALTQEVAYHALLARQQQALHQRIGEVIETVYADRLPEHIEVLAHHFVLAQVWHKALSYLCQAAEKAVQAFSTHAALALYDQALHAATHLSEAATVQTRMAIHQARANLYWVLSDARHAHAEHERGLALARQVRDREQEGRALAALGSVSFVARDFDRALAEARQAIAIAEVIHSQPILAAASCVVGSVHLLTGQLDQAATELEHTFTISRAAGDTVHQATALLFTGLLHNWQGAFDAAIRRTRQAQRIAREHNLPVPLLRTCFVLGLALTGKGAYDAALAVLEEGFALSEQLGDALYRLRMHNVLAWLYLELGDLDRALDLNRADAESARRRGDAETIANAELNLADIFLSQGELHLAQECLDRVSRLVHDPTTSDWAKWRYSSHLFASLGELWLARSEPAKAREWADQCVDIATRTTSRKYLVKGWRLHGEIALACRQWEVAGQWLQRALAIARTMANPTQLWKTHMALGHLHVATRRPEEARQAYHAAGAVIESVKAGLQHPALRASMVHSPLLHQVDALRLTS
jgi:class 3 adenylate cyclase/DNA-binding winged helix-turn-helix (wHTH) protein/tetratricopeptide (TPR) repeat protein